MPADELTRLREQVAATDRALVDALNERLRLVERIRRHKERHALPFLDREREAWLLEHLAAANRGPLSRPGLERFVETVLELTKHELAAPSLQNGRAPVAGGS